MKIRKLIAGISVAMMAFSLAACGGQNAKTSGATDAPDSGGVQPTLVGSGKDLHLSFPDAPAPKDLKVWVQNKGTGRAVESTDTVVAHYLGQVWKNEKPFDSSFERGAPTGFPLSGVIPGWQQGLAGLPVGTKVIISVPPELGYGPDGGRAQAGIGATDVIDFYVEIVDAFGVNQAGDKAAKPEAKVADLPVELTGAVGEPVKLSVKASATAPTAPASAVIARGSGASVAKSNTTVYVQYAMSLWDNSQTEVTYGKSGPQAIPMGRGSLFDALTGVPVGSRVLITYPETSGGDSAQRMPSLAVVVDILGQVDNPPAAADTQQK
ncbi:MAG: FKBP-type peptidyl-prolyl cis-trans isomerase [Actinomycetaceae bacterium]|nr:FKBP-type peptidyl-prolyl cis-trans isomerase [Actinomycetaceae bacterium]MDY5854981.1 FKBP-type peptidyl-prolyl cis-trans isomerase [Arcanobacterium sp.]